MRVDRVSPAMALTRSQCRPAQLTMKSAGNSPAALATRQPDPSRTRRSTRAPDFEGGADPASLGHHRRDHGGIVHDALLRHAQCRDAGGMRLDFADARPVEPLQPVQAVLLRALMQVLQSGNFDLINGHHELAADLMGDAVLAAEFGHLPDSLDRHSGLG